ncbi:portal protein [Comamonas sp. 4034]|uniref:portal protein n=1 Tax=Comamonas sp. 4034 TaxID=3156455 RepID=UPI003D1B7E65
MQAITENNQADMQHDRPDSGADIGRTFLNTLLTKRREAISGRAGAGIEEEWTEDEEHYQGIDDANRDFQNANQLYRSRKTAILSGQSMKRNEGGRSVIFLNITRSYTDAASARVSDMLLPIDDRCWEIKPTPLPQISPIKLTALAQQMGAEGPEQLQSQLEAQQAQAEEAALRMQDAIEDPLVESNWHGEVRQVIEDSARIGSGVLKGPFPVMRTVRVTQKDPVTGLTAMVKVDEIQPASKRIDPWNLFPDPSCGENIHHGSYIWERECISKRQIKELLADESYDTTALKAALKEGPSRVREGTEATYRPGDDEYEMWIFYGYCAKEHLAAIGVDLEEDEEDRVPTMAVLINDRLVKCVMSPQENGEFPYDVLAWQRRPGMPWGMGISRQIRTTQRMLNASARAMMDNGGLSAAPQIIIGNNITPADGNYALRPGKVWRAEANATVQDVRGAFNAFVVPSVQNELMNIINFALKMAEDTTGMPAMLQGIRGDAPNTLGGMQMQNNNATSVLRRLAKRFDDYMTAPHIRRYFDWMMIYSDDESIKGDFQVDVRASSALVERDAQQQFLMSMLQAAANPLYKLDPAKLAAELCKGQRLDPKKFQMDEDAMQAQQPAPDPTLEAKAGLLEAQQTKELALARKADAEATNVGMETLYSGVQTAQVIAAVPQAAGLADGLARSVGFKDQDVAPIYPEADTSAIPPIEPQENTDPMHPGTPVSPDIGMKQGIETQRLDGVL